MWLGWLGGLSVVLPSLLTAHLLDPAGRGRLWLENVEVVPYHLITALSAVLCGLASTVSVAFIESPRHVLLTGLMSFLAALTAQLTVLPLLMRSPRDRVAPAGQAELHLRARPAASR